MTKRPPTPTGWSDTDWVKKLQDDEENPLACLHINQGNFDAAADAYEEEYKRSGCTALELAGVHRPMTSVEVAEDLEAGLNSYGSCSLAAKMLRQQHAEIERLRDGLSVVANGRCADVGADVYADRVLMGIENETD